MSLEWQPDLVRIRAIRETVCLLAQLILGVVLLAASIGKIAQPYEFLSAVYEYGIVKQTIGYWIALLLPWTELLVGAALIVGVAARGALLIATGLSLMFTVAKILAVHSERVVGCGCVVLKDQGVVGIGDVLVAFAMFVMSALLLIHMHRSRKIPLESA